MFVFLVVAAIVGSLLARALEERARAARGEREARLLNYFATKLLSGEPLERVLDDFAAALLGPFGSRGARSERRAASGTYAIVQTARAHAAGRRIAGSR